MAGRSRNYRDPVIDICFPTHAYDPFKDAVPNFAQTLHMVRSNQTMVNRRARWDAARMTLIR